jgi:hypothetical protein
VGSCYLSLANFWLEQADAGEEEEEDEDNHVEREQKEHALDNLNQGIHFAESKTVTELNYKISNSCMPNRLALEYFQKALTKCTPDDEFKLLCLVSFSQLFI